jgi:hypothetical protein
MKWSEIGGREVARRPIAADRTGAMDKIVPFLERSKMLRAVCKVRDEGQQRVSSERSSRSLIARMQPVDHVFGSDEEVEGRITVRFLLQNLVIVLKLLQEIGRRLEAEDAFHDLRAWAQLGRTDAA